MRIAFILLFLAACETQSCVGDNDPNIPRCVGVGFEGGGHVTHPECQNGFKPVCVPIVTNPPGAGSVE